MLGGEPGDSSGVRTRLRVLKELAPLKAPREGGAKQCGDALARSLGITARKLEVDVRAAALREEGRHAEADALLDREGLGHLKACVNCVKRPVKAAGSAALPACFAPGPSSRVSGVPGA